METLNEKQAYEWMKSGGCVTDGDNDYFMSHLGDIIIVEKNNPRLNVFASNCFEWIFKSGMNLRKIYPSPTEPKRSEFMIITELSHNPVYEINPDDMDIADAIRMLREGKEVADPYNNLIYLSEGMIKYKATGSIISLATSMRFHIVRETVTRVGESGDYEFIVRKSTSGKVTIEAGCVSLTLDEYREITNNIEKAVKA